MFHGEPVDPRATKPDPVFYSVRLRRSSSTADGGAVLRRGPGQLRGDVRGARLRDLAQPAADGVLHRRPDDARARARRRGHPHGRAAGHRGDDRRARRATRPRPGCARANRGRVQRRGRAGRVRPATSSTARARDGLIAAEVELGFPARLAAVRRRTRSRARSRSRSAASVRTARRGWSARPVRRSRVSTRPARSRASTTTSTRSGTLGACAASPSGAWRGVNAARETARQPLGAALSRAAEEPAVQFRRVARRANDDQEECRWRVSRPCGAPSTWRSSARR